MNQYTITITGPEGTEIHEGSGFLLFLQKESDKPESETVGMTSIIGHHFNDSLLPEAIAQAPQLLPLAFSAAGLAMGRHFTQTKVSALEPIIQKLISKDEEDKAGE